jgi:protease PrsW
MLLDPNIKLILFATLGGFLPAFIWLWFWLKEDTRRPEPIHLIVRTFLIGGLFIFLAFILQKTLLSLYSDADTFVGTLSQPENTLAYFWLVIPTLALWSLVEEVVKYLAAAISAFSNLHFDEPIDSMIYMITSAIGFAAIENTLFLVQVLTHENVSYFVLTGNLRFLGATVVHIVSSAIVGGFLSLAYCGSWPKRIFYLTVGIVVATSLHALFNFFIIISDSAQMFKIFLALWLVAIFVIYFFEKVKQIVCLPRFKTLTTN